MSGDDAELKTALIIVGVIILVAGVVFCYLLIAGADQSRKKRQKGQ